MISQNNRTLIFKIIMIDHNDLKNQRSIVR